MQIIVVPYNPEWPQKFQEESIQIRQILGEVLVDIHHIGSTSVPGLMAKPIIDMLLDVRSLYELDAQSQSFEALGYEVMGAYGIPGRRYFRKGGDNRTHHIHAFQSGDSNLTRHLAFRDYLRAHPEVADTYGKLKLEIAQTCDNDMEKYGDGKDAFVKLYEGKALEWVGSSE